eukprot:TRINITY_DN6934_c0_g3_i1.p1 TRINITY_DN6934_c0_g3~~TRINITY_DN6934_c0_g3_i1.p1  ORF type:complete len:126 (-),score=19.78 TRINITY_DN6934_c0_g3_i1:584-961(-)
MGADLSAHVAVPASLVFAPLRSSSAASPVVRAQKEKTCRVEDIRIDRGGSISSSFKNARKFASAEISATSVHPPKISDPAPSRAQCCAKEMQEAFPSYASAQGDEFHAQACPGGVVLIVPELKLA